MEKENIFFLVQLASVKSTHKLFFLAGQQTNPSRVAIGLRGLQVMRDGLKRVSGLKN